MFHETFFDFYFRNDDVSNGLTSRPDDSRRLNGKDQRVTHGITTHQGFNGKQALQHEKTVLEVNETTKLHKRDTTSSYDESLRYAQPYKLIPTTSTTHPVNNETPDLYSEGVTLSNFIHEGRPTTTKLTLVDLPSSIDHSTFHECTKGILCLALTSHQSPLTRQVVIISYSLHLGRKNTLLSTSTIRWRNKRESTPKRLIYSPSKSGTTFQVGIQSSNSLIKSTQKLLVPASTCTSKSSTLIRRKIPTFLRPTPTTTQLTSSYATCTTVLATQTTSAIIEIKNDKSL